MYSPSTPISRSFTGVQIRLAPVMIWLFPLRTGLVAKARALEAQGKEITTVEGLATAEGPHPLQDEFDLKGAAQCGFCTPGILCSAAALLERTTEPSRDQIKGALAGNLCRCTGYTKILDAVEAAAMRLHGGDGRA